jgi:hypothetical protein
MNDGSSAAKPRAQFGEHRAETAGYRLEVSRGRGLEPAGQEADLQAVPQARAVLFVKHQVAEVRQRHPAGGRPVGVHPERHRLRHDPAREERRRLHAEQLDELRLEPPNRAGFTVEVPLLDAKLGARPRQVREGLGRRAEDLP